jgi:hypothetical protein
MLSNLEHEIDIYCGIALLDASKLLAHVESKLASEQRTTSVGEEQRTKDYKWLQ